MSTEEELKTKGGDIAHKVVKTVISSVPIAGGALSEIFTTIVADPSANRRDKILIEIDSRLNNLTDIVNDFNIENLITNEVFLSTVSQAYQIALRTHQKEKLDSLMNAITNSAISNVEDNMQQMFLSFIDSFNEWHLRILFLLDDPLKMLKAKNLQTDFTKGSPSTVITMVYPELVGRDEFNRQVIMDLYNRSLISTSADSLKAVMSGSGMVTSRTTEFGKQFIRFVS